MDEIFDKVYDDIKYGRLTAVEDFLTHDGDPNLTNKNGWTLVMSTAFKGNSRILTLLIERGANINSINVAGCSALSLAAGSGHQKCVKLLLAHGADVHVRPHGQQLLAFMKYAQHPSELINQLLIKAGAR